MAEVTGTALFQTSAQLNAAVSIEGSWSALTSFVVNGLQVEAGEADKLFYIQKYAGEADVPADIRRLRKSSFEMMRRMGQPVIIKHMFNDRDNRLGIAKPSPVGVDAYGQQVRNRDPYSYGTGFCSIQTSPDEWIDPNSGAIVTSATKPAGNFLPAPMYRGYGPGYLTYIIAPDAPVDLYKLSPAGAIIKTQSQTVQAPWFPEINDNDLIINVELDRTGRVVNTYERFQAKQTQPITIRGLDRRGRREFSADHGNRYAINQSFSMSALPASSVLMQVEVDR